MKIQPNKNKFETCPEFTGRAVCVDVTPLRKVQSQFGERDVFRVVFEVDLVNDHGNRFCVWSRNFTPSVDEKANFRKFIRSWFGRDLTQEELADFETETLIGKPAQLVIVHEHRDGQLFANIAACTPDRSGSPLAPSGKFVRRQDRDEAKAAEAGGNYRRTQATGSAAATPQLGSLQVHVGKYKGMELRDLTIDAVQALVDNWLPAARENQKPTAADKRLIAALDSWVAEREQETDNAPY